MLRVTQDQGLVAGYDILHVAAVLDCPTWLLVDAGRHYYGAPWNPEDGFGDDFIDWAQSTAGVWAR